MIAYEVIRQPTLLRSITASWLTLFFFFSSRRRHTRCSRDWSSDVCSSDLSPGGRVDRLAAAPGTGTSDDLGRRFRNPGRAGPASRLGRTYGRSHRALPRPFSAQRRLPPGTRSEEHTSELQSRLHLVCRLLLEKKKTRR